MAREVTDAELADIRERCKSDRPMNLYELTNGQYGESYVRCYAWAESVEKAREAYKEAHGEEALGVYRLFASNYPPFITALTDDGDWGDFAKQSDIEQFEADPPGKPSPFITRVE